MLDLLRWTSILAANAAWLAVIAVFVAGAHCIDERIRRHAPRLQPASVVLSILAVLWLLSAAPGL